MNSKERRPFRIPTRRTPLPSPPNEHTSASFLSLSLSLSLSCGGQPFEDVSAYWGCPVCCLRTMKSEVACGISREDERRASEEDGSWLVSGRYGVVHART